MPHLIDQLANPNPNEKKEISILRWETDQKSGKKLLVIGNTDYISKSWHGLTRNEWMLDPQRDMIPVILRSMTPDGRVGAETTIDYEQNPTLGYFPREVVVKLFEGNSTASRVYRARVEKLNLNATIDPSEFKTKAPFDEPIYKELAKRKAKLDADIKNRSADSATTGSIQSR